jgi:hypothetical protein
MYVGGSNVAQCISGALKEKNRARGNFRRALKALKDGYRPSGVADSMALREQLKNWSDTGLSHADWEAGFTRLESQLTELDEMPPIKEVDNLKNPQLSALRQKLMLDATVTSQDYVRQYTHITLRDEASRLASSDKEINNWGVSGATKIGYVGDSGGGKQSRGKLECWRCGGEHLKFNCTSKKCAKCSEPLCVDGKMVGHDARKCSTTAGGGGRKVFEKGGDKGGGNGKMGKKARVQLPSPDALTTPQLKAFAALARTKLKERAEGSGKTKKAAKSSKRKREVEEDSVDGQSAGSSN